MLIPTTTQDPEVYPVLNLFPFWDSPNPSFTFVYHAANLKATDIGGPFIEYSTESPSCGQIH